MPKSSFASLNCLWGIVKENEEKALKLFCFATLHFQNKWTKVESIKTKGFWWRQFWNLSSCFLKFWVCLNLECGNLECVLYPWVFPSHGENLLPIILCFFLQNPCWVAVCFCMESRRHSAASQRTLCFTENAADWMQTLTAQGYPCCRCYSLPHLNVWLVLTVLDCCALLW